MVHGSQSAAEGSAYEGVRMARKWEMEIEDAAIKQTTEAKDNNSEQATPQSRSPKARLADELKMRGCSGGSGEKRQLRSRTREKTAFGAESEGGGRRGEELHTYDSRSRRELDGRRAACAGDEKGADAETNGHFATGRGGAEGT